MLYTIKNNLLTVTISDHGAELKSIKYEDREYLHDANPAYWGRTAPFLWPNIGTIKNGYATIDGVEYPMKKHGFLRDCDFLVTVQEENKITFVLKSNEETLKLYPFNFINTITYELTNTTVNVSLNFQNKSLKAMPFNLGLHPAFKVPLTKDEKFEDYYFEFDKEGTYEMPVVNLNDGTIDFEKRNRSFINLKELPLNYDDYLNDALIFENINSHHISLKSHKSNHGVNFEFNEFSMLGLWTPIKLSAPFICIEPWIGCADRPDTDGTFTNKRDLIWVKPNENKTIKYSFNIF